MQHGLMDQLFPYGGFFLLFISCLRSLPSLGLNPYFTQDQTVVQMLGYLMPRFQPTPGLGCTSWGFAHTGRLPRPQ